MSANSSNIREVFLPPAADPTNQDSPVQHMMQSQQTGPQEVTKLKFYQAGKTIGNGWGFKTPSGSVDGFETAEAAQRVAEVQKAQDREEAKTGTGPIAAVLREYFAGRKSDLTGDLPTPRTDAVVEHEPNGKIDKRGFVNAEFCRGLERELADARESNGRIVKRAEAIRCELVEMEKQRDEITKQRDSLAAHAEELMNEIGSLIPDANCSCHLHPPCSDCVEFGGIRYILEEFTAAIAACERKEEA